VNTVNESLKQLHDFSDSFNQAQRLFVYTSPCSGRKVQAGTCQLNDGSFQMFARFLKDESGATAIEYGLIAALIAVAIIGGVTALGEQSGAAFNEVADAIEGA
jgi:pilus assembly protein Flp/PilA